MTRYTTIQLVIMSVATALLFYFGHFITAIIACILTVLIATLALFSPSALHTFQEMGKRVGGWVGTGIGIVLLTLVYFTVFLPANLLLRIARVDLLDRRFPTGGRMKWPPS
jgi:hypothetical protein